MTHHPMVPTNEQIKKWENAYFDHDENLDVLLIQAYQAGADAQLEVCCDVVGDGKRENLSQVIALRNACRHKPPSLADEALIAIEMVDDCAIDQMRNYEVYDELITHKKTIISALEQLKQLEGEIK